MSQPIKVGGIILDSENHLLIVYGKSSHKWGVPKGTLENNESFLEGALREIKEETGLGLKPILKKKLEFWHVNRARLYLLQVDEVKPILKPVDEKEILEAKWLDLNDQVEIDQVKESANKMLLAILRKIESIIDSSNTS